MINDYQTPIELDANAVDVESDSSLLELIQTDETVQTDFSNVSNDDFLAAIYGVIDTDNPERALVCGLSGDPAQHKGWRPWAWPCDTSNGDLNWYAMPALYVPSTQGAFKAQKTLARGVYCAMVDDLGTKVPLDKLDACLPSWVIETSPGNYQAGYIFREPVEDLKLAEAFKDALIKADLCDKGASGAAARWMRLPQAINGKTKYGHPSPRCRLVSWAPQRRYTIDEIVSKLQLDMFMPGARKKTGSGRASGEFSDAEEGVHIPRPAENQVIFTLKERGLYKKPLGGGKHDITCPWVHEHTDSEDSGSCYFEPSDGSPIGGFKCHHSHGDQYRISALLTHLGVSPDKARHKATIKVRPGELARIVDAAEMELAASGHYYQRGGLIVEVVTDAYTERTKIQEVSPGALTNAMSRNAIWMRYDKREHDYLPCDPPERNMRLLYDRGSYIHLPTLVNLTRQPCLRATGTVASAAGYDESTMMFGVFDQRRFNIPEQPTKEQAQEALSELRGLLAEFAFAGVHDESAAIAGMITATIRPSLPLAPMFHIKAPQIASGKSYLSGIIAAFAGPDTPPAYAFPTNEEECQKLLLATLLQSPAVIVFDNLTTDLLPYKSLCSALTEEFLTGRILGVSKTATVGTRTLFMSSGNNVQAVRDMGRRTVTITLDPQVETPAARTFAHDPLREVRERREHFVSLALTIVRAWIVAGSPMAPCKTLASYGQWSNWVRQPLIWLGMPDPTACVFEQMDSDPDREALGRMLHAWQEVFGNSPTMIREAVNRVGGTTFGPIAELREAMLEVADLRGEINRRRLGKWISRHQGRVVDCLKFERGGGTTSAERWSVKSVSTVSTVKTAPAIESVIDLSADDLL